MSSPRSWPTHTSYPSCPSYPYGHARPAGSGTSPCAIAFLVLALSGAMLVLCVFVLPFAAACVKVFVLDGPETASSSAPTSSASAPTVENGVQPPTALPSSVVIVYGTTWCPACTRANEFFDAQNVPHLEKNIEKNAAAEREMASKLKRAGIRTDSIPVIDIDGEIVVGFDEDRIRRLLARRQERNRRAPSRGTDTRVGA